jgi:RNA 2',3'-cyclic 3'-phosphodiesterase
MNRKRSAQRGGVFGAERSRTGASLPVEPKRHAFARARLAEAGWPGGSEGREALGPSARKHGLAVRAFFAIALGEELREGAAMCARELALRPGGDGVRWVAPASYHLTLRFLGNVAASEIGALAERAQDALAGSASFALSLGAPLAFPTPRRPRVIALAAQPEDALAGLAARLERAASECGIASDGRTFRAHLTIGRVRARRLPALAAAAPAAVQLVREVVLFRSDLSHDGAHYSPLATLALGAGAAATAPGR